jgi:hypothetical protein
MKIPTVLFLMCASALAFGATLPPREDTRLDSGWRFKQDDAAGAESMDFSDADWAARRTAKAGSVARTAASRMILRRTRCAGGRAFISAPVG